MNKEVYSNYKISMNIKDDDTLESFRKQVEIMYDIPAGSFLISHVHDMVMN